jgi:cation:H+ antiporter
MIVSVLLGLLGLAMLTVAADQLVLGAAHIAARFGISPIVVGVVVIGVGTSTPEFLVSGLAAAHGETGLAVGTLVGSNLLNLSLILGLAAAIGEIRVSPSVIRREIRLAVAAVLGFAVLVWLGLTVWTAIILAAATLVALWMLVRWTASDRSRALTDTTTTVEPPASRGRRPRLAEAVRAGVGLAGVLLGAELLVTNAAGIAARLGIPPALIGFTVLALGTSVPELVTALAAQRRGETDLVIGNLFGSNLFNSLAGGAVVGFANGRMVQHAAIAMVVAMALTAVLAWALAHRGRRVTRVEGAVLLGVYVLSIPLGAL